MKPTNREKTARKAAKLGLNGPGRTLWICADRGTAKCCSSDAMRLSVKALKKRCRELRKQHSIEVRVFSTKCLDICHGGPLVAVMPDGVWYGGCTPEVVERIVQEHLIEDRPVEEHVIARRDEH